MPVPDFSVGEVFTAAAADSIGMWRITTCTVTSTGGTAATASNGVITVGSGNTTVTINNAFSTHYIAYRVVYSGGTLSTTDLLSVYLGTSAGSAYYGSRNAVNISSAAAYAGDNNTDRWNYVTVGTTTDATADFTLVNPFESKNTYIQSLYAEGNTLFGTYTGKLNNTTSYTAFTFDPQGATTMSGGTIRVYGYRN